MVQDPSGWVPLGVARSPIVRSVGVPMVWAQVRARAAAVARWIQVRFSGREVMAAQVKALEAPPAEHQAARGQPRPAAQALQARARLGRAALAAAVAGDRHHPRSGGV